MTINGYVAPVPVRTRATPNITPFTYRDGLSYLQVLEELRKWLRDVLVPEFGGIVEYVDDQIADMLAVVDQAIADNEQWTEQQIDDLTAYVDDAVQQIINSSIEVQDPVVAGLVRDADSETRKALDSANAEDIENGGDTRDILDELYGVGFEVKAQQGQSLAGGTGADYEAAIDNDFNGVYYYGVTPGESDYEQINPVTSLPLSGGLVEPRGYGLMGDIIAARTRFVETGVPQLIVPTFAGGAGFYSHNTVPGRWLVGETVYANLAQLSVAGINNAISAGRERFGPLRKVSIMFNGGEADRDIGVERGAFSQAAVDLVNYVRSNVNYSGDIVYVFARQLPERRVIDGRTGVGVDAAILDLPGLIDLCAVAHSPYGFVTNDGAHANSAGQRMLGNEYVDAFKRAETSRSSVAPSAVENLKINEYGRVTWDPPKSGKVTDIRVYRVVDGAPVTAGDIAAGSTEYNPVTDFGDVRVGVRAYSAAGSEEIVVTDDAVSPRVTGKLFDIWGDSLTRTNSNAVLRDGDWMSTGGSFKDFGIAGVAGQPIVDATSTGHRVVDVTGGGLATAPGYLAHGEFTIAVVLNVARTAGSGLREIIGGDTLEEPSIFFNGNATTIGVRGADADTPVTLPYSYADTYACVILRKTGGSVKLDVIPVSRVAESTTGIVSNTALSLIRVSSTREGERLPLNANIAGMMMLDWNIPDGSVGGVADELWQRLSL